MPKVQSFDHEKGGHSRRGRRTSTSLAEINVVLARLGPAPSPAVASDTVAALAHHGR